MLQKHNSFAFGDEVMSNIHLSTTDQRREITDELKILGFWFGPEPNASLHVRKIKEIRKLTRWGMPRHDLVKITPQYFAPQSNMPLKLTVHCLHLTTPLGSRASKPRL